ncbi:hypothetical protein E4U27_002826 [Claviceps purpurea]|nr:hypothetical protein E4U28_003591 [Claviceps purpurea]KAG6180331.1 hypothetical protein E4U27_002826 [Claviceps purpurea]
MHKSTEQQQQPARPTTIPPELNTRTQHKDGLLTWVTRVCQALGVYFYVPDGNRRNTPRKPASDAGAVEVQ